MSDLLRFARNNTWVVQLFFAGVAASALLYITREDGWTSTFAGTAVGALLTAFLTGLLITVAEKHGWLANYQDKMNELEEKIDALPVNYREEMSDLKEKIGELPTSIQERLVFGLRSIEEDFNEVAFLGEHKGDEICWLNTFFRFFEAKEDIILDALKKGCSIRLLFLDPDAPTAEEKAYYTSTADYGKSFKEDTDSYLESLRSNVFKCIALYEKVRREHPDDFEDRLQIRFYRDSPNLPIVLMCDASANGSDQTTFVPKIAASGFYLDRYSSQLPYIVWHTKEGGGEFQLVRNLYSFFNRKWNNPSCRSLQQLRDSGRYDREAAPKVDLDPEIDDREGNQA